jgi:hypothetical protein
MAKAATKAQTKSDRARQLLDEGKSVADLTRLIPGMGYAFAYGIAKRYGKAETAAHRRQPKTVQTVGDLVQVAIVNEAGEFTGYVRVNTKTGQVTKGRK